MDDKPITITLLWGHDVLPAPDDVLKATHRTKGGKWRSRYLLVETVELCKPRPRDAGVPRYRVKCWPMSDQEFFKAEPTGLFRIHRKAM